jgi:hypothetical protein
VRIDQHHVVEAENRVVERRAVDANVNARAAAQWPVVLERELSALHDT